MPDATSGRLTTVVDKVLVHNGLAPSHLCLELTESEAMSRERSLLETLAKLGERGISIALDDFGTGHPRCHRLRKRYPGRCVRGAGVRLAVMFGKWQCFHRR